MDRGAGHRSGRWGPPGPFGAGGPSARAAAGPRCRSGTAVSYTHLLDLHFVNDVLIGCRKTYEQELLDRLEGQTLESCTAEEREAAEKGALEVILNNDSWETDEDYLKLVLADYTEQVLEYQSEHPGLLVPKND